METTAPTFAEEARRLGILSKRLQAAADMVDGSYHALSISKLKGDFDGHYRGQVVEMEKAVEQAIDLIARNGFFGAPIHFGCDRDPDGLAECDHTIDLSRQHIVRLSGIINRLWERLGQIAALPGHQQIEMMPPTVLDEVEYILTRAERQLLEWAARYNQ